MRFLVEAETTLPPDLDSAARADLVARETMAGQEHIREGRLVYIWRIPGRQANVAVWECADTDELHAALTSLPAWSWMSISVRPLATHPLQQYLD